MTVFTILYTLRKNKIKNFKLQEQNFAKLEKIIKNIEKKKIIDRVEH